MLSPGAARGEESGGSAQEEMQGLMNEMGVIKPPTFEEAVETIRKAGLEPPPVPCYESTRGCRRATRRQRLLFLGARLHLSNVAHHG